jgi:hypothetical protein
MVRLLLCNRIVHDIQHIEVNAGLGCKEDHCGFVVAALKWRKVRSVRMIVPMLLADRPSACTRIPTIGFKTGSYRSYNTPIVCPEPY